MFEWFRRKRKNDSNPNQKDTDIEEIEFDENQIGKLKSKAVNMDNEEIEKHKKHFSDSELWQKIQRVSKKAGLSVVYVALLLYYTLQKPDIPMKAKATIAGSLGYFILPIDLIPDVAPGIGYADDLAVLTAAIFQVAMYIDEEMKGKARNQLKQWFGDDIDTSGVDEKLQ